MSQTRPRPSSVALYLGSLCLCLSLASCKPSTPQELPGAASEPAGAIRQLVGHLRKNDLAAFARDAVPPAEHAQLAEAWARGYSRWPVTELPLDDQLAPLLATLSSAGASKDLRRQYDRQFAGQEGALRDATRALVLFGRQYVQQQGQYSGEERSHYAQVIAALGQWASRAPLADRKRAYAAIDALHASAAATGLSSEEALNQAGMVQSLTQLGPFLAQAKSVTASYGLDLDHSLDDLRVGLVEEEGDRAIVRIHYPLAGTEIDTTISLHRRDGHWYMSDYLEHAATILAQVPPLEAPPADPSTMIPAPEPAAAAEPTPGR